MIYLTKADMGRLVLLRDGRTATVTAVTDQAAWGCLHTGVDVTWTLGGDYVAGIPSALDVVAFLEVVA